MKSKHLQLYAHKFSLVNCVKYAKKKKINTVPVTTLQENIMEEEEKVAKPFSGVQIALISNTDRYFEKTVGDGCVLPHKILAKQIQQYIKRMIYHDQLGL